MLSGLVRSFIDLFCRCSFDRATGWQTEKKPLEKDPLAHEKGIYCASCDTRISGHERAISFAGAHRHRFSNPAGVEFEIVLYRDARVHTYGPATEEYTWFAGYAWQVVLCANCQTHLGWRYRRSDSPDFYGLIIGQIIEK